MRSAPGWLRYRLGLWLDGAGAALPSHRQELDERAARTRAEVDRWLSTVDELRAGRTDARPHAARIRAQLGWT